MPQVVRTAHMLGIDLIFDSDLLYVAEEMLMQPLPGEEVGGDARKGGGEGPVRLGAAAGGGGGWAGLTGRTTPQRGG